MKRKIGILLCAIMLFTTIFSLTGCSSITNDYCRITELDYKAVLVDEPDSEGKVVVTERITFDVHAASQSNLYWELWRDLSEEWTDGVRAHYKVNSVKQVLPNGEKVTWAESPELYWDDYDYVKENTRLGPGKWFHSEGPYNEYMDRYECVFFYVDGLYREKITFEIEYERYNSVLRYNDCADLYLPIFYDENCNYLEKFNVEILIPDKDMPSVGNFLATTYGTDAGTFPVEESATKNPGYYTFSFNLDEDDLKFSSYNEYLEFELVAYGEDKHKFADYTPENTYTKDNVLDEIWEERDYYIGLPQYYKKMQLIAFGICVGIALLAIFIGISKVSKLKKKYPPQKVSDDEVFRDIPSDLDPKFANALVFCRDKKQEDDSGVYSAILLSLARKKYIDIVETSYSDAMIILNEDIMDKPQEPSPFEQNNVGGAYGPFGMYNREENRYGATYNNSYATDNAVPSRKPRVYDESDFSQPAQTTQEPADGGRVYAPFGSSYTPSYETPQGRTYEYDSYGYEKPVENQYEPNVAEEPTEPKEPLEPLTISEEYYLKLIKRHTRDGNIRMSTFQNRVATDYDYTRDFARSIKKTVIDVGIGQGYLQKANWLGPRDELTSLATMFTVFGMFALIATLVMTATPIGIAFGGPILTAIALFGTGMYLKSKKYDFALLTDFGETEYRKWRGLYNFLKSDTLIKERTVVELPLWEKYLVYATAFGISEKVINAIKIRCPEATSTTTSIVHNNYCRSGRIRTSGRSFHRSIRSGSIGGSYGYGGGGRGSGGGGH